MFLASLRFPVGSRLRELARLALPGIRFRLPADSRGFAADALVPWLKNRIKGFEWMNSATVWVYHGISSYMYLLDPK